MVMGMSESQKRSMKAAEILAIRLELNPEDILWEGIPDIKPSLTRGLVWIYKEVQRGPEGEVLRDWHANLRTKERSIVVPPELYQEFLNHMEHGVPGE